MAVKICVVSLQSGCEFSLQCATFSVHHARSGEQWAPIDAHVYHLEIHRP